MRIFVSHSTKDKHFVEKLAVAMTATGFQPWHCEVEIETGANFVAEISRGLKASDLLLLVWSPDAAKSAWTEAEWTSALKQQVEESRIRLGIVMLRQYDLPPLLATTNYIDATRDPDAGVRNTIDWLKRRESAQRLSGLRAPVYLPEYRPQEFVGRRVQLELLRKTLSSEPSVFLLHGEPGTGKSTLALQFAWDAQKDFDAVIFQSCGQRPLDAIVAELVERILLDLKSLPPDKQKAAAKAWLRQRQSLLVLDDVWLNDDGTFDVRELEPGPPCSVLYTSRLQSLPGVSTRLTSRVENFTGAEAEKLFHYFLDPVFGKNDVNKNRQALLNFADRVEMLPIAVSVGAGLLRENTALPLGKGVAKLRLGALADGAKNVNQLFGRAIDAQPEREQKLLTACAVCVQEGFWLPLAAQIAQLSEDEAENAANALVRRSLLRVLDRDRQRFQLHALLREQLRTRAGVDGWVALQERHAVALEELFEDWETRWRECRECLEEIIPNTLFLGDRGESFRAWQLSYKGYKAGRRMGDLDVAFRIMQLENKLACERDDKIRLESSYSNLANILCTWGRLDEAMELHQKQGQICLELGDQDGEQRSYGNQAGVLVTWGRPDEALALLQRQESICIELDNTDALLMNYSNQSMVLQTLGRLEEAMAFHEKQVALCLRTFRKADLEDAYGGRASILWELGRFEEAFAVLRDQEAVASELGDKDALEGIYGRQAVILQRWGKYKEARRLFAQQEAMCLELDAKASLAYCYANWGLLARAQGDRANEKQKLRQALSLFTKLGMHSERKRVQADLDQSNSASS